MRMRLSGGKQVAGEAEVANAAITETGVAAETAGKKTARASTGIRSSLSKQISAMQSIGRSLTKYVSLPILGVAAISGKFALDFDRNMRNVNSIAQLPERQFERLKQSVLDLAGPTAQAPNTLAEGLYDLVSSGFTADEAIGILHKSALAASAGLTTTEVATKAVAAALNAYHLPAKAAGKVSDTLFETVNRGVLTFDQLANSIGDALPFASQLGVGLDQVGAAISTMTKQGLSAPESVTRLKNVMVTLIKPGKDLQKALDSMNTSGADLVKKKGLQGALEAIIATTDGSKESVAALFPNIRALGGVLSLTGKSAKSAHEDLAAFQSTTGATAKVLKEQEKSFGFQMQRAWASLQAVLIEIGQEVLPIVIPPFLHLVGIVRDGIKWFSGLPAPIKKVGGGLAVLAAMAGPMLLFASAVLKAATNIGILKATEGGGFALNKGGLARGAAGVAGIGAIAAGQSGVGGDVGKAVGNVAGGAALGFSMGGPWGAAIGGGLGAAVTAIPLIVSLFDSHKVNKLKAQTDHLKSAMDSYRRSIKGVKAGEDLAARSKNRLRSANEDQRAATSHLANVLARFGVGSRQAHKAQLDLARAERGVTRAARAEEHAHRLSGNRLKLYRINSLAAVASIKQSIPTLRHRVRELNREEKAGTLSVQGLERLVKMEGHLETAKNQLTGAYAKAESLAGKPWAKRLQSLTTLQATYGRQGNTLKGQIGGVRESMSNLRTQGLQTTEMYKEQATEVRKLIELQEKLIETAPHPGGDLGKHPRKPAGGNPNGGNSEGGGHNTAGKSGRANTATAGASSVGLKKLMSGSGKPRTVFKQPVQFTVNKRVLAEGVVEVQDDEDARA